MDEFTKRKISVYGINGCLDALKSDLVEINQIYIEKESPASKHKEIESLYSGLSTDKVMFLDEASFSKKVDTSHRDEQRLWPLATQASTPWKRKVLHMQNEMYS